MQKQTKMPCAGPPQTDCPITRVIGVISSKWALPVLYNLLRAPGPLRFGVLRKSIGRVTQRELSLTLKRFEEIGVVNRKLYAEVPPRVEYSLTALGRSLEDPILALGRWAERHAGELLPGSAGGKRRAAGKNGSRQAAARKAV